MSDSRIVDGGSDLRTVDGSSNQRVLDGTIARDSRIVDGSSDLRIVDGGTDQRIIDDGSGGVPYLALSGPSSGRIYEASTNFTATLVNGVSTVVFTPTSSSGTGSFSPSTVTLTVASPAQTFTYTPTSTGARNVNGTNDGGLSAPVDVAYTVVVPACTAVDLTASRIYQRAAGTGAKTIAFSGAYTNSTPSSIEVKIVNASGGATIQDWTEISGATIAAGSWSGTLSVPWATPRKWYHFLARAKFAAGQVLATSAESSNAWTVGILVGVVFSQSDMSFMNTTSSSPASPDAATKKYTTAGGWAAPTGNGNILMLNKLAAGVDCPVGILPYAISSVAMHASYLGGAYWMQGQSATDPYGLFQIGLTAAGGDIEFAIMDSGKGDMILGTTKTQFKADYDTALSWLYTSTGRNATTLKAGLVIHGTMDPTAAAPGTGATADAIIRADIEWVRDTSGAFCAASTRDLSRFDDFHWSSAAGCEHVARRIAQSILYELGAVSYPGLGPSIAGITRLSGSAVVTATLLHNGGAGLTENDGSTDGVGITGFRIDDSSNMGSNLTIASTAYVQPNKIALTLSAAPDDSGGYVPVYLDYQYGMNPDSTSAVYDDTTAQGAAVGLPLQPTNGTITVTSQQPVRTMHQFRQRAL